jgi:drug/metabolite transporter (DMT)-like permease
MSMLNSQTLQHSKGIILALTSTFMGALITILYKPLMSQGMPVITISLVESCAIICMLSLITRPLRLFTMKKRILRTIVICSICQAIGNTCFYYGLSHLDPVTFSFLTRNQAVFSVIFGFFLLGERHDFSTWLFIAFALVGSILLCYADLGSIDFIGIGCALMFCLCFGIRNFYLRKFPRTPALINIFLGYVLSIVLLLSLAILSPHYEFHSVTAHEILQISTIAIIASFGTIYFFQLALRYDAVSIISSIRLFSPFIVAIYFGWGIGYKFSPLKTWGMSVMTMAILTLVYTSRQKYLSQQRKHPGTSAAVIQDAEPV